MYFITSRNWNISFEQAMIWLIDVKKNYKWAKPFIVYGSNSIFIFVIIWNMDKNSFKY